MFWTHTAILYYDIASPSHMLLLLVTTHQLPTSAPAATSPAASGVAFIVVSYSFWLRMCGVHAVLCHLTSWLVMSLLVSLPADHWQWHPSKAALSPSDALCGLLPAGLALRVAAATPPRRPHCRPGIRAGGCCSTGFRWGVGTQGGWRTFRGFWHADPWLRVGAWNSRLWPYMWSSCLPADASTVNSLGFPLFYISNSAPHF